MVEMKLRRVVMTDSEKVFESRKMSHIPLPLARITNCGGVSCSVEVCLRDPNKENYLTLHQQHV